MDKEKMLVYSQKDMQAVMNFVDSLSVTGVASARRLASVATMLESGKPMEAYLKAKDEKKEEEG